MPKEQLPVTLPTLSPEVYSAWASTSASSTSAAKPEDAESAHEMVGPLGRAPSDWLHVRCPKCGGEGARRETDTMDTFVDSSWYFVRYLDARNSDALVDPALARTLLPVDVYVGGIEHGVYTSIYKCTR